MKRFLVASLTVAAVTLFLSPVPAGAAAKQAAPGDHTVSNGPISITVPAYVTIQTGEKAGIVDPCGFGQPYVWTGIRVGFTWKASSTVGPIVGYDLIADGGEGPYDIGTTTTPGLVETTSNYDAACGGGSDTYGYQVVAHDSVGNSVTGEVWAPIDVTRYNNTDANSVDGAFGGIWTYSGKWSVSKCVCADGASQTYTTARSAIASFALNAKLGEHVALMMAEGPGRGSAKVYVDGVLNATINTHFGTNTNRVITWDSPALKAGGHVIKIVNLATPGHARIDVNAAVTVHLYS
jgi:hypothetical protein